ncbi:MAG: GumC family protein, partial [Campylobacterota bacterium]|nr:GumC family protein [Campylobacterota bacterium]
MKKIREHHSETYNDEDEIDIKEIFSTLLQYKKSIIFFTIFAAIIASYRAYFTPSVYEASAILKISTEQGYSPYNDFLSNSIEMDIDQIESETVVFESYDIAKKAIEKLNIGTRYFTEKRMRIIELYKNSPFVVTSEFLDPELYDTMFKLVPVDENKFRLVIEAPSVGLLDSIISFIVPPEKEEEEEPPIVYDKVHTFSEKIDTEWFSLSVQKIYKLKDQKYAFSIVPNEEMIDFVQGGVSASSLSKFGNILEVSFIDNVPMRATDIVNRVAESYIENSLDLKSESARKQLHFIDKQLEAIDKALKGSAEELQRYKVTNVVVDLSEKAQMTASKLSELQSKLYEINMDIDIMESILNHIKTQKDISSINMDYSLQASLAINSMLEDLQTAITKYATLSVNYTEKHPEIIVAKRQIESLKKSLREALANSLRTIKNRKSRLLGVIDEQKGTMKSFPGQEQELGQLTRSFMVNEKIYSFLLEKRAETAIMESSTISNTRIIDKARSPGGMIKPKRKLIVLVGLILGFILGVAQAFLRDFLDNSIKTSEDIEKLTHIPLYAIT